MPSIPLEPKALIVHELAQDEPTLSALNQVWPETIPYIRDHRFKDLNFYGYNALSHFNAVMAGAPAILSAIRSISMTSSRTYYTDTPLPMISQYAKLMALVRTAPNLEELCMSWVDLSQLDLALAATPSSIQLKTFTINESHITSLTVLLDILHSFPISPP